MSETRPFTLVAVHGNGGGGFRFARVAPYLPPEVHFVPVTLPGFADAPVDPGLKTLADYARHLGHLAAAQPAPVILLGTGIGGSIILELLQKQPNAAVGVILHAPVGTRLESRRFPALMKLSGMRRFGQWLFSTPLARPLWRRLLFVDHRAIPPDFLKRFFDEYRQCRVFGQMFDLITAEWYASLKPLPIPAALLWGQRERVLKAEHVTDYQQLLPQSRVRIVPEWDHFPMIEQPADYAREVVLLAHALLAEREVG